MKLKLKHRITSCLIAMIMVLSLGVSNAYASGTETFYLNHNYYVGSFTFTDQNTTPVKTVQGRYLYTYFNMSRASIDQGIPTTPIVVTVEVIDANTYQVIKTAYYYLSTSGYLGDGFETDLGYAGREIRYRFDASSYNGPTNGHYRSAYIETFMVNTSNTQGMYWDS